MAAIYQWFVNKAVTVTTTPYPIEVIEGVEFAGDLDSFNARDIWLDEITSAWSMETASMRVLLKSYGPDTDEITTTWSMETASMRQLLKTHGPDTDEITTGWSMETASMVFKLISTQIYPHGLNMAPQLNSFNMGDAP